MADKDFRIAVELLVFELRSQRAAYQGHITNLQNRMEALQYAATQHISATPNSATGRVFALPEFLEQILINVPRRTLLLAQRTNKTFSAAVHHSVTLKRKMFLRLGLSPEELTLETLLLNPFFQKDRALTLSDAAETDQTRLPFRWDPMGRSKSKAPRIHIKMVDGQAELCIVRSLDEARRQLSTHTNHSWQKMYICRRHVVMLEVGLKAWFRKCGHDDNLLGEYVDSVDREADWQSGGMMKYYVLKARE